MTQHKNNELRPLRPLRPLREITDYSTESVEPGAVPSSDIPALIYGQAVKLKIEIDGRMYSGMFIVQEIEDEDE